MFFYHNLRCVGVDHRRHGSTSLTSRASLEPLMPRGLVVKNTSMFPLKKINRCLLKNVRLSCRQRSQNAQLICSTLMPLLSLVSLETTSSRHYPLALRLMPFLGAASFPTHCPGDRKSRRCCSVNRWDSPLHSEI